jgi:SAM-dependent methyltransferase
MSTPCPLCGHDRSRQFPVHYEFDGKRFQAMECGACSFVFLWPRLTHDELNLLYSDEYFLHDGADCGAHSSTDYETAARKGSVKFPEIMGWIRKRRPGGKFFEIGCGMGYFLDYARAQGYEVSGIEYADLGVRTCREKFGLNVMRSSIEEYRGEKDQFDVVFMGDVLEHLIEPCVMLEKVHRMLKPGGIVAAEVPATFNSLMGRMAVVGLRGLGRSKKLSLPPYHVNEFLPGTLKRILLRAGFGETVIVQRIKAPSTITLRGTLAEKTIKKSLHYPNFWLTKSFGIMGDRLLGIGIK